MKFGLDDIFVQSVVSDSAFFVDITCSIVLSGHLLDTGVIYPFGNASKTAEQKIVGLVTKHR